MKNRFSVHPGSLRRSLRYVVVGTALLATTLLPAVPAAADAHLALARASMFHIESPDADAMLHNGEMVDIGGWTAGSRVDAYLDGPAGFGAGIGTTAVASARPDVAAAISPELAASGFNLAFTPVNLVEGSHTLYVYSLIDGAWVLQTRSILTDGLVVELRDSDGGPDQNASVSVGTDTSVGTGSAPEAGGESAI